LTIKAQVRLDLGTAAMSTGGEGKRQFLSHKGMALGLLAAAVVTAGLVAGTRTYAQARIHQRAAIAQELAGFGRTDYLPQKAIYHVDYDAGWFEHNYSFLLSALQNHERAVGADKLHLVVVLQGNGLDLLAMAKTTPALAKRIDKLKGEGVRFLVCKNSLVGRAMDPFTDLYGVAAGDIVTAAVAELVALQQDGYIYLHL
jgi:hypothetical protein